jgi:Outer membrane protein beta-barrel domain
MKKCCLLGFIVLFSLPSFSQNQFGLFAGGQATTAHYKIDDEKQETKFKYGFQAGVNMKVPFDKKLYFAPMAFYSMKGYDVTFTQFRSMPDSMAANNFTTIHTFELAPLLQIDLGNGPTHGYIRFGPSIDFQLAGKEEYDMRTNGSVSRDMPFGFDKYGRVGANLLFHLGLETNGGFFFFGHCTYGFGNINNTDGGPEIRHRGFGISIGKFLNSKKIVIDTKNKE